MPAKINNVEVASPSVTFRIETGYLDASLIAVSVDQTNAGGRRLYECDVRGGQKDVAPLAIGLVGVMSPQFVPSTNSFPP